MKKISSGYVRTVKEQLSRYKASADGYLIKLTVYKKCRTEQVIHTSRQNILNKYSIIWSTISLKAKMKEKR